MKIPSFITDLFTEKDGVSVCPVRLAFIAAIVFYIYNTAAHPEGFIEHAKDWASGIKDLMVGGLTIAAKAFTEKDTPDA